MAKLLVGIVLVGILHPTTCRAFFYFYGGPVIDVPAEGTRSLELADTLNRLNNMIKQMTAENAKTKTNEDINKAFGDPYALVINLPPGPGSAEELSRLKAQIAKLKKSVTPGTVGAASVAALERQVAMTERNMAFYAALKVTAATSSKPLSLQDRLALQADLNQITAELLIEKNVETMQDNAEILKIKQGHIDNREAKSIIGEAASSYGEKTK